MKGRQIPVAAALMKKKKSQRGPTVGRVAVMIMARPALPTRVRMRLAIRRLR